MQTGFFNPLFVTLVFILLSTFIAAFIRGRKRDKCLKSFDGFTVTLEDVTGKSIWGRLRVEPTGLELVYPQKHKDIEGHDESSYLLYKYEYGNINNLARYHDKLSPEELKQRQDELERTYHPNWFRRFRRKLGNIFKTIRDSMMEVSNVLLAQAKKTTVAGGLISSQDKYISQMKNEMIGSVETSYEPLLERYIGHRVVTELAHNDTAVEIVGILKDYTPDFIELLDVDYAYNKGENKQKADLILPRKRAVIRHCGE